MDWNLQGNQILFNPRLSVQEQDKIKQKISGLSFPKNHIWIATSGSISGVKWVALSKEAIFASATAVNHHLHATKEDIWLNPLPLFHVGGLGILARAHLCGAKSIQAPWNVENFVQTALEEKVTLSALVPAQVYDLVLHQKRAPPTLRMVIVGGGVLSDSLYDKAKILGWPLVTSYGLTEAASQVATAIAGSGSRALHLLSHLQVRINASGYICLAGASLLTGYLYLNGEQASFVDPKVDGWLQTEDRGEWNGTELKVYGRGSDFIKIGGESVDLVRLNAILDKIKIDRCLKLDCQLIPMPDERLGHTIHLAVAGSKEDISLCVDQFQLHVLPFEKIRCVHRLDSLPRSPLGKFLFSEFQKDKGTAGTPGTTE